MDTPALLTVKQFSKKHPAFPQGGLRHQIFNEHTNGLAESNAIVRVGRKVLIDEKKYFQWVFEHNNKGNVKVNSSPRRLCRQPGMPKSG